MIELVRRFVTSGARNSSESEAAKKTKKMRKKYKKSIVKGRQFSGKKDHPLSIWECRTN